MPHEFADVIVIGGGAAGLAAADVLSAAGKSTVLLEARQRLGGRIDTAHDPAWPLPIERGAEFIHGKPPETWDIVRAGGCCLYDLTDEHWVYHRGKLTKPESFMDEAEKVLEIVNKIGRTDMPFDAALKKIGRGFKEEHKKWARSYVEGFNAADAGEISCRWLAVAAEAAEKIEGDRLFRVYSGYDRVIQFLRTGLGDSVDLQLGTVVQRIEWGGERIRVHALSRESDQSRIFEASKIILTLPLGVLKAQPPEGIIFDPPLPSEKQKAVAQLRMGNVAKVILRFQHAFWEDRFPELNFMHAPGNEVPFPTWWTTLPVRTPMLTGWAGGPPAAALAGLDEGEILNRALVSLEKLLHIKKRRLEQLLEGAHICDWGTDPFARGAYSYAAVGGAHAAKALAKPVQNKLFFAGEATHPTQSGTVAGAIATGRIAAQQAARSN